MMSRFRVCLLCDLNPEPSMPLELTLPAMTCGHCVKTVTATVQRLDPQAQVNADLATHVVRVETSAARDAVVKALAAEGYPAAP
jgi:copper chaperone